MSERFTNAELAAEFYRAAADFQSAHSMEMIFDGEHGTSNDLDRARDWMFWTERFALTPHYDEAIR